MLDCWRASCGGTNEVVHETSPTTSRPFGLIARFIAPIHDELVTSIIRKDVVDAVKVKHECMVAPYSTMTVPVLGSISIGPDFGEQHECGDWYIKESIEAAVSDIFGEREAA